MKSIRNFLSILICIACCSNAFSQIFYKLEKGDAKPSYIFGTHHLASTAMLDTIPGLKQAIEECGAVIGEVDMTGNPMQLAMSMQKYMIAPPDSTINLLLSPEEFHNLNAKFSQYSPMPGADLNAFAGMKPMVISSMATMTMLAKSLPEINVGEQLDTEFQKIFVDNGKKVIALETPEMQAELLYCSIPISRQLEQLKEILNDPKKVENMTRRLNEDYLKHDLKALYDLSLEEDDDPEFQKKLIADRNSNWISTLTREMENQPVLIVVGALHLPGENGVLSLLQKEGYTITPIN